MSFSVDINSIANTLKEARASQEIIDKAVTQGKSDPIEEGKMLKFHKAFDDAETKQSASKKVSTIAMSQKKYNGIDDFLRGNGEMNKTVLRTKAANSSYEYSFNDKIQEKLQSCCIIRQLANNVMISGEFFEAVTYLNAIGTSWSADGSTVAPLPTTANQNFIKNIIKTFDLTAQPQITSRLLADTQIDLESYVLDMLCDMFALQENNAFINGDGITMPRGILKYPSTGAGSILRTTSRNASNISVDGIMNLYYSLSDLYTQNASFIMHKSAVYAIRTMKDAAGQYLWLPGVLSGTADTLLGCPLYTSNYMPQVAAGNDVVIFGDIKKAYTIVDRGDLAIQRDPFSSKPYINFFTTKRIGGDITNPNAINVMRIGA
jgi:HK97 family phage major capsid protein